jgi:hypothetical protein
MEMLLAGKHQSIWRSTGLFATMSTRNLACNSLGSERNIFSRLHINVHMK